MPKPIETASLATNLATYDIPFEAGTKQDPNNPKKRIPFAAGVRRYAFDAVAILNGPVDVVRVTAVVTASNGMEIAHRVRWE